MRQATPDTTRNARGTRGIALLATLFLAGFFAAPAQAGGNEFDDGFQDQLGRLVASEVFHLGKRVIASGHGYGYVDHAPAVYPVRVRDDDHRHRRYRHHDRHHYKGHGKHHGKHYYKHARRHHPDRRHYWRQHHGHDHAYRATCSVSTHERVRRNRHGEVVEYERHERRGDRYARH